MRYLREDELFDMFEEEFEINEGSSEYYETFENWLELMCVSGKFYYNQDNDSYVFI